MFTPTQSVQYGAVSDIVADKYNKSKLIVFCDVAPCNPAEIVRRFRRACCRGVLLVC
jgi:hypothetical protein